ncbi:hypothetical protein B1R32_1164 [Abditibacterium utsteinense]|uniref:Pentapeptide MXKDX repeat protein n=1 Tax=Abditibacterium utsteinense TaxID=1960156 RepID=A0A2S8SQG6_9BACT|nr:hypothetical protein [Abditibacterium utsteinense]PQV63028.1 hypothetical protein B1R32_1164 [Abditibacterium utsteinense]
MNLQKIARLGAALAVTGALALPSMAQDKMMDSKMAPKMSSSKMSGHTMSGSKMTGHTMMSDKMVCQMCKMTPAESKTYMGMSKAEKMLFMKHMDKMGMSHSKMMGGKMSGKM